MSDPNLVRAGLFDMQICVPKETSDVEVIQHAERLLPCGTTNGWFIRRQETYDESAPGHDWAKERVQCEKYPENVHITLDA